VAASGTALAFVVYPEGLVIMNMCEILMGLSKYMLYFKHRFNRICFHSFETIVSHTCHPQTAVAVVDLVLFYAHPTRHWQSSRPLPLSRIPASLKSPQLVIVEVVITAILDQYPQLRRLRAKTYVVAGVCTCSFFAGIIFCTPVGLCLSNRRFKYNRQICSKVSTSLH
jgi:hypothetical protein